MMLEKIKKISSYRKSVYILLVIIVVFLIVLLVKILKEERSYDQETYDAVYKEFNEIMAEISNPSETDDELISAVQERYDNLKINTPSSSKYTKIVGRIVISKININFPIISETTYKNLKVGPTKFYGCNPNEVGNLCIVGHNNRNGTHFSRLKELVNGDLIEISGTDGKTELYEVYEKYEVEPTDLGCTSQETNGEKIVTLITCTNNSKKRLVVRCKHADY